MNDNMTTTNPVEVLTEADLVSPLSAMELSRRLGVTTQTLKVWRMENTGPKYFKVGTGKYSHVRYRMRDVLAWEKECVEKQEERLREREKERATGGGKLVEVEEVWNPTKEATAEEEIE